MSEDTLTYSVSATAENHTKTVVDAGGFEVIVDEPAEFGGTDAGPSPVEMLLSAWAGCLNVTGHAVAEDKGMRIESLDIDISGTLNPAKFMGEATEERAGFQSLSVTLKVDSRADDASIEDWIDGTKKRCAVTDNITEPTPVNFQFERR